MEQIPAAPLSPDFVGLVTMFRIVVLTWNRYVCDRHMKDILEGSPVSESTEERLKTFEGNFVLYLLMLKWWDELNSSWCQGKGSPQPAGSCPPNFSG